jgi:hypothetical protein
MSPLRPNYIVHYRTIMYIDRGIYHTRGTRLRNHTNRERYFPELYYIAAKNYVLFLYLINTIQIRRQGQNDSNTQLVPRSNHI